jgi:peptide/nickel transport system permease protein
MTGFVLRRLLSALPTLLGITLLAFAVLNLLPGDPRDTGPGAAGILSAEASAHLGAAPDGGGLVRRYLRWTGALLRGDLGTSIGRERPVAALIAEALPWTVLLNACALAAMYGLGVSFGLLTAARPRTLLDRSGGAILLALYVLPAFAAALLLQQVFAVRLRWLPLHGIPEPGSGPAALARHLALPAACLALAGWAFVARFARASFAAARRGSYLAAARARGARRGRAWAHAAANAAVPLITLFAAVVPALVGGSVIVEQVFSWPGLGRLYLAAVEARDTPVVLGLTLLSAVLVLLSQLAADLLHAAADPRVRAALAGEEAG